MRIAHLAFLGFLLAACGGDGDTGTDEPGFPDTSTGSASTGDGDSGDDSSGTGGDGDDGSGGDGDDGGDGDESACALPPAPTGLQQRTIDNSAGERRYLLAVPDGYSPEEAAGGFPLVFGFHGLGSNAAQFRSYSGVEGASAGQAIFVYPQGLPVNEDPGSTGWDLTQSGRDIELFDDILAEVSAEYCVDPARVYSTGHSFGGFFSNELACARGDVIAAIGSVAGGGPFAESCNGGPVRAWITHGRADTVVPFDRGEASRDYWTAANECPRVATRSVEPPPCGASSECGDAVVWCPHEEGVFNGHGWPRYSAAAIWAFFARDGQ